MNPPLPACPDCGQTYALNANTLMATPGRRTTPVEVVVPTTDVYGVTHGHHTTHTSRWVQDGPSVKAERTPEGVRWECPCGGTVVQVQVAFVQVACTHDAPEGGVCRVRAIQVNPPSDLYVNPRHGARCECCGHQGTHNVPVTPVPGFPYPRCLRS